MFILLSVPLLFIIKPFLGRIEAFHDELALDNPVYIAPRYADFWVTIAAVPFISMAKYILRKATYAGYQRLLPSKYTGELREERIQKGAKNLFKLVYFATWSLFCHFYVLKGLPYHSENIFGTGSFSKHLASYPYVENAQIFKFYYLVSAAYHLESTIEHCMHRPKNDFYELMCHHMVTLLLILFSYMMNYTAIGIHVMIVMDNADIPIGLIRSNMDFAPGFVVFLQWIAIMTSWIYTRIYVYSADIIRYSFFYGKGMSSNNRTWAHDSLSLMLWILMVLNIYWGYLLLMMGLKYVIKRKATDLQQTESKSKAMLAAETQKK